MAKRTPKPSRPAAPSTLFRIGKAASLVDVPQSTLFSAVERGEIAGYLTGCELPLVHLPDVEKWATAASTRKPGRKPKQPKA
jgi:hypothetical protein